MAPSEECLRKPRETIQQNGRFHNAKPMEISPSSKESLFNDIISFSVKEGSGGVALLAVVAVTTCMAVVSFLLMLQYEMPTMTPSQFTSSGAQNDQCAPETLPHWAALIHQQIQVIQNLVHASLLGGAGFVAAFRGDVVWLYFARNCCFFFGLAALSYLAVDIAKGRIGTTSFIMSALMSTCCIAACIPLEFVRQQIASHVVRYASGHEANYPKFLPSTRSQLEHTTLIARLAECLQLVAIMYSALTTLAAILEEDCDSETSTSLLEMSYREGAHQAFLLSLLFLASIFPGDQSCVGGAIICSAWRLALGLSYVFPISSTLSTRATLSLVAAATEIALMLPIFIAALMLLRENFQSNPWNPNSNVKYSRIEEDPDDNDDDDENDVEHDDEPHAPDSDVRRIQSLSMLQISKSANFSSRQRQGAFVMWLSSASLLAGMTVECIFLLGFSSDSFEIYQWGMHVAAMYLFCAHMSVNSAEVYSRARYLLCIACPTGSAIAAWQLRQLFSTTFHFDYWTSAAAFLFGWRALCGIGQCLGIALLNTTEPQTNEVFDSVASAELVGRMLKGRFVLFKVYIPALFLVVITQGIFDTCSEPLISPSTPDCVKSAFVLAKHWPGLGTFFHFGGLLVIFSTDALVGAGYSPSLAIATFFAAHVTILLAGDLVLEAFGGPNDIRGQVQSVLKVTWMLAAGWLWFSLHGVWKWRIAEG